MKQDVKVYLGDGEYPVGTLHFAAEGRRQASAFEYDPRWLASKARFQIDHALPLVRGPQYRGRSGSERASVFHGCFADSEPDGWGIQVIQRDHAKSLKEAAANGQPVVNRPLNELDVLLAVDDVSRVGALRFEVDGKFVRATESGKRSTPPLIELRDLLAASQAIETGTETARDLAYLRGRGTSLGGMRPKCSVIDDDGVLSIAKFPSVGDTKAVTKGEVLALKLADLARIEVAEARIVHSDDVPVTLVRRFDRDGAKRFMYASARTMLQIDDDLEHSYTEIADAIVQNCQHADRDREEMWRRVAYTVLINNVDDHMTNHGFLHIGGGKWRLSPAFDINPFPDKARVLKTWISEASGADASITSVMEVASYFKVTPARRAREVLHEVVQAVAQWRQVASDPAVGMTLREIEQYEGAFEHAERAVAERELRTLVPVTSPPPPTGTEGNENQTGLKV